MRLRLPIQEDRDLTAAAADVDLEAFVRRARHQATNFEVFEAPVAPVEFNEHT